ncbi:efflux RND transporter permease subunit [Psychrobium sp. nBUS_13]|uniref:efflux RND transporter permease subunit n=1 Tax=Psychrobium sp. nBUS_13 TaxID=3395319 RepID=UPI003EBE0FA0
MRVNKLVDFSEQSIKRRIVFTWLSLLVIVGLTMGVTRLDFNSDYRVFFDEEYTYLQAYDAISEQFSFQDSILVIVKPPNNQAFTEDSVNLLHQVETFYAEVDYVTSVDSIFNYLSIKSTEDEIELSEFLLPEHAQNEQLLKQRQQEAQQDLLLSGRLVSKASDVAVIQLMLSLPQERGPAIATIAKQAYQLKDKLESQYPKVEIYLSGGVMLDFAFMQAGERDLLTLFPMVFLIALVLLFFILRSWWQVCATLVVMSGCIVMTLGLIGYVFGDLNIITVQAPLIVLILGIADSIHLISGYNKEVSHMGPAKAMVRAMKVNFKPMFLTTITTAFGFLSMNFSESPPFNDLGNITAISVFFALGLTVFLLPCLLLLGPIPKRVSFDHNSRLTQHIQSLVKRHDSKIILLSIGLCLFAALHVTDNVIDDDAIRYFDRDTDFRQAADFADQHMAGVRDILIAVDSGETEGVYEPDFMLKNQSLIAWLRQQPEVNNVYSFIDKLKSLNQHTLSGLATDFKVPDSSESIAQLVLLYEMSLPYGYEINHLISMDKSSIKLHVFLKNLSNSELLELEARIYQWQQANFSSSQTLMMSSPSLMFAHVAHNNINKMLEGWVIAILVISLTLALALGSWQLGLFAMITNILPAFLVYGGWGLWVGEMNMASAVVFSISLGIVVDDTVHLLTKFQDKYQQGFSFEQSVTYSLENSVAALITTTLVLCSGLIILAQSSFAINSTIGVMTCFIILLALLVDIILLPALAHYWRRSRRASCE